MKVISALCGAVLIISANTAQAQNAAAAAATPGAQSSKPATPADAWSAKPLGKYDLVVKLSDRDMPTDLTITESDGKFTALFWPVGDNDGHYMTVTVNGTDLVLNAEAPRGHVVIHIERRGARLTGTWQMGSEHGTLEGTIKSQG